MTRDDRLHEIDDHIGFLDQLSDSVLAQCPADVHITVLGFSQGTATVSRWLAQARFRPAHLILWAGGFPDDLDPDTARYLLANLPLTVVSGTDDEHISASQIAHQQQQLQQLGATPTLISFTGKHELNRAVLAELAGASQ